MPATEPVDLLVIGGGTAGLVASRTAASLGASVLLVDAAEAPGGDCLWSGCVPSKAFIAAAGEAHVRAAGRPVPEAVFHEALRRAHDAVADIAPVDSAAALEQDHVRVRRGTVRFTGPRSAEVHGDPIAFRQAVVATGATPRMPSILGIESVPTMTSESFWDLAQRPARLLVLGGGPQGCEFAQACARLGVAVVLVQRHERLLPGEVPEASELIRDVLVEEGVDVRLGRRVSRFETTESGALALLDDGARVEIDLVLAAIGREPRVAGLGLDAAGVELGRGGRVRVQRTLRTTNPRIWAAGDVTPLPQYTHTAGMNGSTVAFNAILGLRRTADDQGAPRVTFTQPEVAGVGRAGVDHVSVPFSEVDRAIASRATRGFSRIELDGHGRLTGATVVGPRAGETIGEAALAVRQRLRVGDLAQTTHPYPTWSDGLWNASIAAYRTSLTSGVTGRALGVLAAVQRRRMR